MVHIYVPSGGNMGLYLVKPLNLPTYMNPNYITTFR
jgi:hypothetical protein